MHDDGRSAGVTHAAAFRFLTVGTSVRLIRTLWDRIARGGGFQIAHLVHPTYDRASWDHTVTLNPVFFVRDDIREPMPSPDRRLLESLEGGDVPTIHNMIMSDRVVTQLDYEDALAYATLLTRRFFSLFTQIAPAAIIGDFDALHSSLALGVARRLGIPWFALNFSTIPHGQVSWCANLSPASLVVLEPNRKKTLMGKAEEFLSGFEQGTTRAPAYVPPSLLTPSFILGQVPVQVRAVANVTRRRRTANYRKYSDYRNSYTYSGLFREAVRLRKNVWHLRRHKLLESPPQEPFAFFGLHMQPESSIDVFAHFFSNQIRVIELIARSLPPTHTLLVKLHKSDVPNYSLEYLRRLRRFPGVHVVAPHVNAIGFIERADLVFAIQGTIALEAALLGKPVIVFGDSPVKVFPSVTTFGRTVDLPGLVRTKLQQSRPGRPERVEAFAAYLEPFYPASHNDWNIAPRDDQIDGYVHVFNLLMAHVTANGPSAAAAGEEARDIQCDA